MVGNVMITVGSVSVILLQEFPSILMVIMPLGSQLLFRQNSFVARLPVVTGTGPNVSAS